MKKKTIYPRVKGVDGRLNFRFLDRLAGRRDGKYCQLYEINQGYSTAYVNRKKNCKDAHTNAKFEEATKENQKGFIEVEQLRAEYESITKPVMVSVAKNGEEAIRAGKRASAKAAANTSRAEAIRLRLAEIRGEIIAKDEMLMHHIEAAEAVLNERILIYWAALRKRTKGLAPDGQLLPGMPEMEDSHFESYEKYQENLQEMLRKISEVLEGGEENVVS